MKRLLGIAAAVILGLQAIFLVALVLWVTVSPGVSYSSLAATLLSDYLPWTFRERNWQIAWHSENATKRVWGYVDRHSIVPGDSFLIHLSGSPGAEPLSGRVKIFRIGHYDGQDRKKVWQSATIDIRTHPVSNTSAVLGPNWPPTIKQIPTDGWRSGYYAIDFVTDDGARETDVAFIVVTNPEQSGDVLIMLSTNTYQAYNLWGGHSFYESDYLGVRGNMVTFDRPTPPDFYRWEYYLVTWLEKLKGESNFTVDYVSDFDIHSNKNLIDDYRLFITSGHSEYWTKEQFDSVYDRIFAKGKNTLFLGANMAFNQVRYSDVNSLPGSPDRGRQMISFKTVRDPIRHSMAGDPSLYVTDKFRARARRPETMLTGVAYQSAFLNPDLTFAYHVRDASLPLFQGTGYETGDFVGNIVGPEWDNTDPLGDGKRLWKAGISKIPELPRDSIQVLFSGKVIDVNGKEGLAEAAYFVSPAGAKVFSAGTIRWAWGLSKPGFVQAAFQRFNRNLILDFVK